MTRSFFFLAFSPWRSQTFLSKAETAPPQKQVTNCKRYFDGGSPPWTSLQITTPRARRGAVAPPSGSLSVGFTTSGRRQFKGSVRSRFSSFFFCVFVDGVMQNEITFEGKYVRPEWQSRDHAPRMAPISDSRRRRITSSHNTTMGRGNPVRVILADARDEGMLAFAGKRRMVHCGGGGCAP